MHITLDNIFAFLILTLIMVTFMGYIIPSAYLSLTTAREHQLEEIAQSVMDKILLNPGHPEEWGNILVAESSGDLSAFGLQKTGGSMYELDVNKILRIASTSTSMVTLPETIRIDPETIARLLGLGHEYGFSIRITPVLNISFRVLDRYVLKNGGGASVPKTVEAHVVTSEGRPAIGANATGFYILMTVRRNKNEDISYLNYSYATGTVGLDGKATFSFEPLLQSIDEELKTSELKKICSAAVVYADYYGFRAVNSSVLDGGSDILKGTAVGQYLIVEFPITEFPKGARQLENQTGLADPPYYVYASTLHNDTNGMSGMIINKGSKKYRVYELSNTVDDDVSLIILPAKYLGNYFTILFFRSPSDVTCQVGMASGNIKTSVLRRMVKVGSFHYTVEVRVWRWAE